MQASGNRGLNWGQSRGNTEREVDLNPKTESNTNNDIMWVGSEREGEIQVKCKFSHMCD